MDYMPWPRTLVSALIICGATSLFAQTITFAPAVPYTSVAGPKVTLVGDFSGDGKLDLGVLGGGFFVIPGNGLGTFSGLTFSSTGGPMTNAAAGDFNEDGLLDIVAVDGTSTLKVMANVGGSTFMELASYPTGTGPRYITVADFDLDSNLDVVVGYPTGLSTYYRGFGNGSFAPFVNSGFPISGA